MKTPVAACALAVVIGGAVLTAEHGLNAEATRDRLAWLRARLGPR
jgi:hypothetical protein